MYCVGAWRFPFFKTKKHLTAGGDVYEEQRCWLEVFQQPHMNRFTLMVQNRWDVLLFSGQAVGTIHIWLICAHRPSICRCLYDGSSNCVSRVTFLCFPSSKTSTVWFLILVAHLLFASLTEARFFFVFGPFFFYQALFTQSLQDMTLAGCRRSLKRTTGGEQSAKRQTWRTRQHWPLSLSLIFTSHPSTFFQRAWCEPSLIFKNALTFETTRLQTVTLLCRHLKVLSFFP